MSVSEPTWEDADDGLLRCFRHKTTYPKGRSCALCDADPGLPLVDDQPSGEIKPPRGCISRRAIEREAVSVARDAKKRMNEIGRSKIKRKAIFGEYLKLGELRLKALRLAGELAKEREDDAIVRERDRLWLEGRHRRGETTH